MLWLATGATFVLIDPTGNAGGPVFGHPGRRSLTKQKPAVPSLKGFTGVRSRHVLKSKAARKLVGCSIFIVGEFDLLPTSALMR